MRTLQEVFDRAYRGLASQGFERAVAEYGCAYRAPNGHKCGIGWLINDEDYHSDIEGSRARSVAVMSRIGFSYELLHTNTDYIKLLSAIQNAHDCAIDPADMQKRLRDVANLFAFYIPEVSQ